MSFFVWRPSWLDYAATVSFCIAVVGFAQQLGFVNGLLLMLATAAIVLLHFGSMRRERRTIIGLALMFGADPERVRHIGGFVYPDHTSLHIKLRRH